MTPGLDLLRSSGIGFNAALVFLCKLTLAYCHFGTGMVISGGAVFPGRIHVCRKALSQHRATLQRDYNSS